eukprot:TRINITY_DN443_c1_g1_i1.p1 TRINITY_DN443_c1_g1~~TRINITY_DN443_c1_g1_i1.p1  ORF type:complete len:330 (-),score=43.01 TRINITY_DN443_c1_g1_i1:78-1067(-)
MEGELADKNELIDVLQQKLRTYKEIIQDAESMVTELQAQIQAQNLILQTKDKEIEKWKAEAFSAVTGESTDQISSLKAEIKQLKAQNAHLHEEINKSNDSKHNIPAETTSISHHTLSRSESSANTTELERRMREMTIELDCLRADNKELIEKAEAYKSLADKLLNHTPSSPQNESDQNEKPATPIAHNTDLLLELNLPLDQQIINYFICAWNNKPGYLYVTQEYIAFQYSSISELFTKKGSPSGVSIRIDSIVSVNKIERFLSRKALEITLSDGHHYLFKGIVHRKELVKVIYAQSSNLKHRFKLLRNGKEDTNTGLQKALNEDDFTSI